MLPVIQKQTTGTENNYYGSPRGPVVQKEMKAVQLNKRLNATESKDVGFVPDNELSLSQIPKHEDSHE